MNCHLEAVYEDGARIKLETSPNGDPDHIFPSRGWAQSSAYMWADSYIAAFEDGRASKDETPLTIDVVLEDDGKVFNSIKVRNKAP